MANTVARVVDLRHPFTSHAIVEHFSTQRHRVVGVLAGQRTITCTKTTQAVETVDFALRVAYVAPHKKTVLARIVQVCFFLHFPNMAAHRKQKLAANARTFAVEQHAKIEIVVATQDVCLEKVVDATAPMLFFAVEYELPLFFAQLLLFFLATMAMASAKCGQGCGRQRCRGRC